MGPKMASSASTARFSTPQAPVKTFRLYKKSRALQPKLQKDPLTKYQVQLQPKIKYITNGQASDLAQSIKVQIGYGINNLQERFRRMWLANEIIASNTPITHSRKLYDCQPSMSIIGIPKSYRQHPSGAWFMDYSIKSILPVLSFVTCVKTIKHIDVNNNV